MRSIEVEVLIESHNRPGGVMLFLAKLTQRGHNISDMADLINLYDSSMDTQSSTVAKIVSLPHGTIKRFTPITIAIVGASRRFLMQIRTHQVGVTYVSASLQYSTYNEKAAFVVPYEILETKDEHIIGHYLDSCVDSRDAYRHLVQDHGISNDTAGYLMPHSLRNILIMQANHESWMHLIRLRSCNRNTNEMQYVMLRIWEALLETHDGREMFKYAGPDCCNGGCREGNFCCTKPFTSKDPSEIIKQKWPLLQED